MRNPEADLDTEERWELDTDQHVTEATLRFGRAKEAGDVNGMREAAEWLSRKARERRLRWQAASWAECFRVQAEAARVEAEAVRA